MGIVLAAGLSISHFHVYSMFKVYAHGTFLPFFAFWHNGPALPSALPYPHEHWHPKSRVVVSFTSMPDDLEYLNEVCLSFGNEC